jgi:hypothetical protein
VKAVAHHWPSIGSRELSIGARRSESREPGEADLVAYLDAGHVLIDAQPAARQLGQASQATES